MQTGYAITKQLHATVNGGYGCRGVSRGVEKLQPCTCARGCTLRGFGLRRGCGLLLYHFIALFPNTGNIPPFSHKNRYIFSAKIHLFYGRSKLAKVHRGTPWRNVVKF
jgi:hypothetical protein